MSVQLNNNIKNYNTINKENIDKKSNNEDLVLEKHLFWIGTTDKDYSNETDQKIKYKGKNNYFSQTWYGNYRHVFIPNLNNTNKIVELYNQVNNLDKNKKTAVFVKPKALLNDNYFVLEDYHPKTEKYSSGCQLPFAPMHPEVKVNVFTKNLFLDNKIENKNLRLLPTTIYNLTQISSDYNVIFILPEHIKDAPNILQSLNSHLKKETKLKKNLDLVIIESHGEPYILNSDSFFNPQHRLYPHYTTLNYQEIDKAFSPLASCVADNGDVALIVCCSANKHDGLKKSTGDAFSKLLPGRSIHAIKNPIDLTSIRMSASPFKMSAIKKGSERVRVIKKS